MRDFGWSPIRAFVTGRRTASCRFEVTIQLSFRSKVLPSFYPVSTKKQSRETRLVEVFKNSSSRRACCLFSIDAQFPKLETAGSIRHLRLNFRPSTFFRYLTVDQNNESDFAYEFSVALPHFPSEHRRKIRASRGFERCFLDFGRSWKLLKSGLPKILCLCASSRPATIET